MVIQDNKFENNLIKIGKNKQENDDLVKAASQSDMWFHLADFPSTHVIIINSQEYPITREMIKYCALKVKENTKYRNIPKVKVNYTQIKNIERTDELGKVLLKSNVSSIIV